eukprot:sb/3462127/
MEISDIQEISSAPLHNQEISMEECSVLEQMAMPSSELTDNDTTLPSSEVGLGDTTLPSSEVGLGDITLPSSAVGFGDEPSLLAEQPKPVKKPVKRRSSGTKRASPKAQQLPVEKTQKRSTTGPKPHPEVVICTSACHREDQGMVRSVATALGGVIKGQVDKSVTHVVVGTVRRTMNVMRGIVLGCHIVTLDWVTESVSNGGWAGTDKFTLTSEFPSLHQSSAKRRSLSAKLFRGIGPLYLDPSCQPPPKELSELVTLCGAIGMSYEQTLAETHLAGSEPFRKNYDSNGSNGSKPIKLNPQQVLRIGMGNDTRVYFGLFVQSGIKKIVAVKRIISDEEEEEKKKINHQVNSLLDLNHPNIIRYFYHDFSLSFEYIALELCLGSLETLLTNGLTVFKTPYPKLNLDGDWNGKKHMISEIAGGLAYMHNKDVVHRDLKPSNILVRYESGAKKFTPVISDFGLSRKIDPGRINKTVTDKSAGSDGYLGQEVLNGAKRIGFSGDVFAFGCLTQYIMTYQRDQQGKGEHPFGTHFQRNGNIAKDNRVSFISRKKTNAETVFADMLVDACTCFSPDRRILAPQILSHPLFWSAGKKMEFLNSCHTVIGWSSNKGKSFKDTLNGYWQQFHIRGKGKGKKKQNKKAGMIQWFGFNLSSDKDLTEIIRLIRNKVQHPDLNALEYESLYTAENLGSGTPEDFYRYCFNGMFAPVLPMAYICMQPITNFRYFYDGSGGIYNESCEKSYETLINIMAVAGDEPETKEKRKLTEEVDFVRGRSTTKKLKTKEGPESDNLFNTVPHVIYCVFLNDRDCSNRHSVKSSEYFAPKF